MNKTVIKTGYDINYFNLLSSKRKNEQTKLNYAFSRVSKSFVGHDKDIKEIQEEYREKVDELNSKYCSVDEKGNILKGDKGEFKFTPENLKQFNKELSLLNKNLEYKLNSLDNVEYEIIPYVADLTNILLTEEEKIVYEGFVI